MSDGYKYIDVDWSDIEPIPQDDGPDALVVIQYNPSYRRLMDIFRGVIRVGEFSPRVLLLTADILEINSANYTVWQYRRDCLRSLHTDLALEFDFMQQFAEENPKSYQIWHHRRTIVEMAHDASRELDFCAAVFAIDAKNYHAWAHRQWVLQAFNLWDGELEYVESLLESDLRNNSAWNQRWFVVHHGPEGITEDILNREMDFCFSSLDKLKQNESAWNYLRGLEQYHPALKQPISRKCEEIVTTSDMPNVFALSFLSDLRESDMTKESIADAIKYFSLLADLDSIRKKYWLRRVDEAQVLLSGLSSFHPDSAHPEVFVSETAA